MPVAYLYVELLLTLTHGVEARHSHWKKMKDEEETTGDGGRVGLEGRSCLSSLPDDLVPSR